MANDANRPERPRVEPEIIPPDRSGRPGYYEARGTHRIYVTKVGPFGFGMVMLALAVLAAVFLIFVLGAFLIWIPVLAVFLVIAAVVRLLRW